MLYPTSFSVAKSVAISDTVNFDVNLKAGFADSIYVGGAGVVAAVFSDGAVVSFTATAGQILPIKIKRVNSTGTTATLLVALYSV